MKLLQQLRKVSTKYEKERLLKAANDLELSVFNYALDPDKMFHVTKFKDVTLLEGEPNLQMFNLLDKLASGEISGNRARMEVEHFAYNNGDLIMQICSKKLRCGVSAKTINSVWPGLVPLFEVQLAKEVPLDQVKFPCLAQIKYDGVRLIALKKNGKVILKTRNGKVVNLPVLASGIRAISEDNFILDGEITLNEGRSINRTSVSGLINSAIHGGIVNEEDLVFHVFDSMPIKDWEAAHCNLSYDVRLTNAMKLVEALPLNVRIATTHSFSNIEEANHMYGILISQGYEGLILKQRSHNYTFKRSKDWIKLKEIKTADLRCIDWEEGQGKYSGMIGALICDGNIQGERIHVKVGSGLSDADREKSPSDYVGKVIEVKYNDIIQDKVTGQWSLFLPRFVTVRMDK